MSLASFTPVPGVREGIGRTAPPVQLDTTGVLAANNTYRRALNSSRYATFGLGSDRQPAVPQSMLRALGITNDVGYLRSGAAGQGPYNMSEEWRLPQLIHYLSNGNATHLVETLFSKTELDIRTQPFTRNIEGMEMGMFPCDVDAQPSSRIKIRDFQDRGATASLRSEADRLARKPVLQNAKQVLAQAEEDMRPLEYAFEMDSMQFLSQQGVVELGRRHRTVRDAFVRGALNAVLSYAMKGAVGLTTTDGEKSGFTSGMDAVTPRVAMTGMLWTMMQSPDTGDNVLYTWVEMVTKIGDERGLNFAQAVIPPAFNNQINATSWKQRDVGPFTAARQIGIPSSVARGTEISGVEMVPASSHNFGEFIERVFEYKAEMSAYVYVQSSLLANNGRITVYDSASGTARDITTELIAAIGGGGALEGGELNDGGALLVFTGVTMSGLRALVGIREAGVSRFMQAGSGLRVDGWATVSMMLYLGQVGAVASAPDTRVVVPCLQTKLTGCDFASSHGPFRVTAGDQANRLQRGDTLSPLQTNELDEINEFAPASRVVDMTRIESIKGYRGTIFADAPNAYTEYQAKLAQDDTSGGCLSFGGFASVPYPFTHIDGNGIRTDHPGSPVFPATMHATECSKVFRGLSGRQARPYGSSAGP